MQDVAILGAGDLGGSLAHVLARRDLVSRIRLIDTSGQAASGKALDIMQAAAIGGSATTVVGSPDVSTVAGAQVMVVADRMGGAEWQGDEGLELLRQISRLARASIVVCAGAGQRDLVERGVRELGFRRDRLFGSAPEALASALRALVALEANGSSKDVALAVFGVPPAQAVVAWDDATIGGIAATRLLDEPTRRRLASRVALVWPPGPYALATAAAAAVSALAGRSRRRLSCFVAPDDGQGRRDRACALPVKLDARGITDVQMPPLGASAQVALDNARML
jgi:malate/lactate dehydrogenase